MDKLSRRFINLLASAEKLEEACLDSESDNADEIYQALIIANAALNKVANKIIKENN